MAPEAESRRRFDRERYRMPCLIEGAGESNRGFITDISASGLFVKTKATHEPGTELRITLDPIDGDPFVIQVHVARSKDNHRAVAAVDMKGLGLVLQSGCEEY